MIIDDVIKITKTAGEIVREGFGQNFQIEFKTNESNLVTEIDKRSENEIISFVNKNYPSHNILAEESGENQKNSRYSWVVDPLDGTTNFAHGLPIFSVSIGVQKDGETICGAVYDVMQDKMYSAEKGSGAFCNLKKISVSEQEKLARSLLVTGFPYDIAENPANALQLFTTITSKVRGIRRLGSAAIDFCYTAMGVFDAYWEVHLHPWDICAGKLIVEEGGGLVTGFDGEEIPITSKKILASNGLVHDELLTIIRKIK